MSDTIEVFMCSFCEQPVKYRAEQRGCRGKCPKCSRVVWLFDNRRAVVDQHLSSSWFYRRLRLLRGREEVGPIADTEFQNLVRDEQIDATTEVMSPELTKGSWVELGRVNLAAVNERIEQRRAERARRERAAERKRKADLENREKLKRGIRSAIEKGSISSGHRQAIEKFALAAGIRSDEVEATISSASQQLVRELFDEALADGILEPREEQDISQLALALGVQLTFSDDDERRVHLCCLAHDLDSGNFAPRDLGAMPFKLAAKESGLAQQSVRWHEIASSNRAAGIPLGGDNYLVESGTGVAYLTTKQVSMVGELQSKKFTLSSVQRVTRYTDGVLFNRSSGKSVFLQMHVASESADRFALVAEHICSGEPVLGHLPTRSFIPEIINGIATSDSDYSSTRVAHESSEPKYTFRVVGDHIGQRSSYVRALRLGEPVFLVPEPENEHDENAVAVYDSMRRQLGYLKREVASWFSEVLSRKPHATANVHAFSDGGSLIIGVYI